MSSVIDLTLSLEPETSPKQHNRPKAPRATILGTKVSAKKPLCSKQESVESEEYVSRLPCSLLNLTARVSESSLVRRRSQSESPRCVWSGR
jgi:hypothetical protein